MTSAAIVRRVAATVALAPLAIVMTAGAQAGANAAARTAAPGGGLAAGAFPAADPYSPSYQHPYRRGVVPTISRLREMRSWARQHPALAATAGCCMFYHGGTSGVGVMTGAEKVYLVFYGSQWGTRGSDGKGDVTLSGDRGGEAPYLQRLLRGLGMGSEAWSGVLTQYCQGVAAGAVTCPAASTEHAGYPAGGALAGVWVDERRAAPIPPGQASGHDLAVEAIAAAAHFGNHTAGANRNAQYVIASPHGTQPDGFPGAGFCAWHDDTADGFLSGGPAASPYGTLAFTNLPYVTDGGTDCGENFVTKGAAGLLDGVSILAGHEYAETVTDQFPGGGWQDAQGDEIADVCLWDGGSGARTADLTLRTGTFAMQPTWANDANAGLGACEFRHQVLTNGGVFNGGFETGTFLGWTPGGAAAVLPGVAHAGRYALRVGAPTPTSGSSAVRQKFIAIGTHLSLWYDVRCPDLVTRSWATVTLLDNTTRAMAVLLPRTCAASSGWKQLTRAVIRGDSYTLTLTSHDDDDVAARDGAYALFDAVTNY